MTTYIKQIGVIGIEAGLCWIGDPCYILHKSKEATLEADRPPQAIGKDWPDFCGRLGGDHPICKQFDFDLGHPGLGVVVSPGAGVGIYPVYAEIVHGRVARVWVNLFLDAA